VAASFCVFVTMMLFGFRTFGGAAQPLLLNNYHRSGDALVGAARFATGCAILAGYPIMFSALKTSSLNTATELSRKFKSVRRRGRIAASVCLWIEAPGSVARWRPPMRACLRGVAMLHGLLTAVNTPCGVCRERAALLVWIHGCRRLPLQSTWARAAAPCIAGRQRSHTTLHRFL
jgi:hypothetical protein